MQTQQTITLFGTVSNSATSRISKNGRKYTAFGVAIISDRNLQAFHYNVVAFGKQGHFAKPLQTGTRIKLVVQAQSQPDNIATLPLLTATVVRPVRPVARGSHHEDLESARKPRGAWLWSFGKGSGKVCRFFKDVEMRAIYLRRSRKMGTSASA
jgi:hypothetical protein